MAKLAAAAAATLVLRKAVLALLIGKLVLLVLAVPLPKHLSTGMTSYALALLPVWEAVAQASRLMPLLPLPPAAPHLYVAALLAVESLLLLPRPFPSMDPKLLACCLLAGLLTTVLPLAAAVRLQVMLLVLPPLLLSPVMLILAACLPCAQPRTTGPGSTCRAAGQGSSAENIEPAMSSISHLAPCM